MKKIMIVFGTRPEAIKMCPLILGLQKSEKMECCVCLTGQHREMLETVMQTFSINADYNLNIMKQNQELSAVTATILQKLDQIIEKEKPDLMLVHGDTASSFAAALAAFYNHIPIGHVEAGLRTYDFQSPFPEEFNRQAVDLITDLYFAPTQIAKNQLLAEGKSSDKVFVTGNTVIDALQMTVQEEYENKHLKWAEGSLLILLTAHRRENIGQPMKNIFQALKRIVMEFPEVKVIYPIHKNPKVRKIAEEILNGLDRIRLIEPLDAYDFHNFMARSYFIMTDSGGIQEEAPALGKPVLVLRNTTERPEGVDAGTLKLIGTEEENIYQGAKTLLTDLKIYDQMSKSTNPYGDGHASERIIEIISEYFNMR